MDAAKMNQAIRIAKLYYELHYNQLEIAAREGISKFSVSRILKNAMDMGIIEVLELKILFWQMGIWRMN